ncbi:hypothetical protein [Paraburkholderia antibiotica]|uniref:Lipoprotein n=1 Tax=Paraburkholderia antibiotica TaxID=2728839 RepID=A0A7Y0FGE3_9BURK|nr:hypothetical protein [Paraburkholderia antibiotica]NML35057.1 hypothetical protein [Paraburkholderia antibiotica]
MEKRFSTLAAASLMAMLLLPACRTGAEADEESEAPSDPGGERGSIQIEMPEPKYAAGSFHGKSRRG